MKLKKFAAVIASFAMAASFSACGNQTSESNNGSTQDTTAAVQASDADTEENAADVSATAEDETEPEETAASSEDVHTNEFDLENGTVLLNNGIEMPILGIGTFALTPEQASDSVYWALSDGYHLIDTANAYNNEEGGCRGNKKSYRRGKSEERRYFPDRKNMARRIQHGGN